MTVVSQWRGTSTWARNRVYVSSDVRQTDIAISRGIRGASGRAVVTQLDDASIRQAVREAEQSARYTSESFEYRPKHPSTGAILQPTLWSEATASLTGDARAELARQMATPAEAAGYMSAGEIVVGAQGRAVLDTSGTFRYYPVTTVEVSGGVRDAKHGASGWAGVTDFDIARVDSAALAARALDKAKRSANPVAVEPGRYTVILEPQAVADLFKWVAQFLSRQLAESGSGPFAAPPPDLNKIGQQVIDRRLRLRADPMDPLGAFVPFEDWSGEPYRPVNWIDQGVLRELSYPRSYALGALGLDQGLPNSNSYRLEAPGAATVTVDDMIKDTQRGLLVTRFSDLRLVDLNSVLCTGYTRDGLWLIEKGKIAKAVKNFRFSESPLFALNNLEQVGTPVRVFDREHAVIVPPVKVRDFNMAALSDAV
jgi:predicted Zn-dependent protease